MFVRTLRPFAGLALALVAALGLAAPATAQVTTIDPDAAIDADLYGGQPAPPPPASELPANSAAAPSSAPVSGVDTWSSESMGSEVPTSAQPTVSEPSTTYRQDDLIGAAEGVFGKGAQGLAGVIEDILKKQGEPNGYIVGREGGAAIAIGLRYGSGTLFHKVEGEQPVYWTGPSLGFDAGANAGNAFILVYNLNNSEDLYKRFAAGEGQAYLVGGFNVSYLRRGDVVLIPVRVGAGLRLGANIGYMKFSHTQKWVPF